MELRLKKTQADFVSLFFVLAVLFGVAIFAVILFNAYDGNIKDNLNNALTASTPVDADANVTKILNDTSGGIKLLSPLFPFLLVGLFAFGLVMALLGKSHPVFFFIGLIILAVSLILSAIYSNAYHAITSNANFSASASEFSVMTIIMDKLPLIIFILFIVISVVLYQNRRGGATGGNY